MENQGPSIQGNSLPRFLAEAAFAAARWQRLAIAVLEAQGSNIYFLTRVLSTKVSLSLASVRS